MKSKNSMQLLLWRHAEAEDGDDDLARPLTENGREQARVMADWIRRHGPKQLRVLASPAVRAQQTAAALGLAIETVATIAPSASAGDLLAAVDAASAGAGPSAIIIVGHQPTLGELAALLVAGREAPWSIKKGALWWLTRSRRDDAAAVIRAVVPPDLAR